MPLTEDSKAWKRNPEYRHVYNKLWLSLDQGLKAAPVPVKPKKYPVFYKPIYNLYGWGKKAFRAESNPKEEVHPGMFWMETLEGVHWTIDGEFKNGEIEDAFALEGKKDKDRFSLWKPTNKNLNWVEGWLAKKISEYEGPINLEGIGNYVIEIHLRKSEQMDIMKSKGHSYCAPIYQRNFEEKQTSGTNFVDLGKEQSMKGETIFGYVTAETKEKALKAKNQI